MSSVMPKVSIVIPVYNGANYMREAIHSALSQTYPNVEVIVVNDGSTDGGETDRIAKSYGERIRYFAKANGGVSTALNFGIEQMQGDYFSWLSHDDVYAPDKVEKQMEFLKDYPYDTIVYCGYELINSESVKVGQMNPALIHPIEKLNVSMFPLLRGLINGNCLLIHKSHFQRVGLFDPALRSTQDYDLWFKMFRGAQIRFQEGLYVKSRTHEAQGTHTMPKHEEDCSNLWIDMMDQLTEEEMCAMEGNVYTFRERTEEFLRLSTPYRKAIAHAKELLIQEKGKLEQTLKNIRVSVIIPFYNRISLLKQSVESVLNQTHQNLELILIDDGSTEDPSFVKTMAEKDQRIRYFRQENKGPAAARNLGLEKAEGSYIAFLDSDDVFEPNKIETQLEFMVKRGCEFSHTSYQRISHSGEPLEVVESALFSGQVFPKILWSCAIAMPTVMVSTAIVKDAKFIEAFDIGEDICFWIELASRYPLGGLSKPLTKVRINETSAAFDSKKQKIGLINIASFIIRHPEFSRYEAETTKILTDLVLLYNTVAPVPEEPERLLPQVPNSKWKRFLLSLAYEGGRTTVKKILYKAKLKYLAKR